MKNKGERTGVLFTQPTHKYINDECKKKINDKYNIYSDLVHDTPYIISMDSKINRNKFLWLGNLLISCSPFKCFFTYCGLHIYPMCWLQSFDQLKINEIIVECPKVIKPRVKLNGNEKCSICLDENVSRVNIPCGHVVTCEKCCKRMGNTCSICRQNVENRVKIYK